MEDVLAAGCWLLAGCWMLACIRLISCRLSMEAWLCDRCLFVRLQPTWLCKTFDSRCRTCGSDSKLVLPWTALCSLLYKCVVKYEGRYSLMHKSVAKYTHFYTGLYSNRGKSTHFYTSLFASIVEACKSYCLQEEMSFDQFTKQVWCAGAVYLEQVAHEMIAQVTVGPGPESLIVNYLVPGIKIDGDNVYCFTGLLVRYLCGCCLAVFVLMTSTLSLALHPTFYDQCTIVGTNPRATAIKTNPQTNSHKSLLAHSLHRHAQDNMPRNRHATSASLAEHRPHSLCICMQRTPHCKHVFALCTALKYLQSVLLQWL